MPGGGDALPEAAAERAALLGVGEAVEGEHAEELEQRADGGVVEHDVVVARVESPGRLGAHLGRRRSARAAASISAGGDGASSAA